MEQKFNDMHFVLCLSGCADFNNAQRVSHGLGQSHCIEIMRMLHASSSHSRHANTSKKLTPVTKARLLKEWQSYGCDKDFTLK